jgi:LysR family transcriptional regulator, glycine cleavage system transcriptional activator
LLKSWGFGVTNRAASLTSLRAFEAAARLLSFTDAARELHVSQAAVSRHVRLLEQTLGSVLFRRLHRQVELTAAGTALAASLTSALSVIGRAVDAARHSPQNRLRISVEPAFAARWLVPRLGWFSAANPNIELELEACNEIRKVGSDTDIAIRFLATGSRKPHANGRKLFTYSGFPVVSGRLVDKPQSRDKDVMAFRLLHDDDGTEWRRWFAAAGLDGFDAAKHLYINETALVLTAALRGQGAAVSASIYLHAQLKSGRLKRIGRTRVVLGDYWLLTSSDRAGAQARAAFVSWFDAEAKTLLSPGPGRTEF